MAVILIETSKSSGIFPSSYRWVAYVVVPADKTKIRSILEDSDKRALNVWKV